MKVVEFIPECNADTALLLALGIQRKHIAKADNNDRVAKSLQAKGSHYHHILFGMTDFDKKGIPPYFEEFVEVKSEFDVLHKQKPNTNQHIIFLKPAVEKWLLSAARSVGVSIVNFGFPEDLVALKKITTREMIQRDKNFQGFIKAIKDAKCPALTFLIRIFQEHYSLP